MKFIAFWEHSTEDVDRVIPKFLKWSEVLKKDPEKHLKLILPPHYLATVNEKGNQSGITIFECDDEAKLIDYILTYWPELKIKIVPLMEALKTSELYLKMRG